MASFRRSLSPYRQYQNGTSKFVELLPHRLGKPSENSSFLAAVAVKVRGFSAAKLWRRPFTRCLLFFILGFLLGVTLFRNENDLQARDFSSEIKPPRVTSQLEEKPNEPPIWRNDLVVQNLKLEVEEDSSDSVPMKQLIVITPTQNRALQAYFLNRLGQVLKLVNPPLLWIVVEMNSASMETAEILRKSGVTYRQLVCNKNITGVKDMRVHQRNTALQHIEHHRLDGIVYFADDDNIYSLELFESLRTISRFGTWPVPRLAPSKNKAVLEGAVCNGSQVIGWHTNEKSKRLRRFHADMFGFAFNSTILWDPKRWRRLMLDPIRLVDSVNEGLQESTFIEQVVEDESQMEAVTPSCSKIMNWHLPVDAQGLHYPKGWLVQKNLGAILPVN